MKVICEDTGGNQLVLGWFPPLWLRSVEGLGADYNVYTAKFGTQDGEYYAGSSAKMRNIVLVLDVNKANEPEQRQQLFAFFPPRSEGTFYYYADDDSPGRKISYYAEKVEPSGDGVLRHFTISLLCPNPLFFDLQATVIPMSYWKKRLRFPFTMPGFSGSGNPLTFSGKGCKNVLETLKVLGKTGQKVAATGKNILDLTKLNIADNQAVVNAIGANKLSITDNRATLPPSSLRSYWLKNLAVGSTYTVSASVSGNGVASPSVTTVDEYDSNRNRTLINVKTFTVKSGYTYTIKFYTNYSATGTVSISGPITMVYDNIQLELGSTATAYEPFVPNSPSPDYPAPITGVTKTTVNSVDYAIPQTLYDGDSYDHVSGTGQATKKLLIPFTGIETGWYVSTVPTDTNTVAFAIPLTNATSTDAPTTKDNLKCTRFLPVATNDTRWTNGLAGYCTVSGGTAPFKFYCKVEKNRLTGWLDSWTDVQKLSAFKAWLSSNPVTVLYQLATPIVITGTPQNIPVLPEDNAVSADGGSVSIRCLGVFKVAERIAEKIVTVYNNTNVAAGLLIFFTARGDVVNPGMTEVRTQKRFKLTARMMNGDTILVNTNQNEKGAAFQEDPQYVDMWHFGDTWLQLQPGENVFQYFADSGADYLDVKIIYMPRYWGA